MGAVTDINEDGFCVYLNSMQLYLLKLMSSFGIMKLLFKRTHVHPIVTIPLLPDFGGVTDWYQEPRIMSPRRLKKKSVKRLVEKCVAKAIEEYEKSRANLDSAGSSGGNTGNAIGTVNVQGCSHKTFMNGRPHSFNGTEGVVGLRLWIENVEQVFETCKCAEEDKVMFAASTFEGRALTWWNGNVHSLD
ncbi:hypothetical protein Tco_0492908 [Tanacetum coccineum]